MFKIWLTFAQTGSKVKPSDKFCINCGSKINETLTRTLSATNLISKTNEYKQFTNVFSWILKKHVNVLKEVTTCIAPYFNSYIVMRENVLESVGSIHDKDNGNIENLLFRLPIVLGSQFNLDALVEIKEEISILKEDLDSIRKIVEPSFELYLSTKKELEAIKEVTTSIFNDRKVFAKLRKEEDITILDALSKYEDVAAKFTENVNRIDFSNLEQEEPEYWVKEAEKHQHAYISIQSDTEFYSWPWMGGRGISTDLERQLIPFFDYTSRLDEMYMKCNQLFTECKNETGFLKRPSNELKKETLDSLHDFNASFISLSSLHWYSDSKLKLIERIKKTGKNLIDDMNFYSGEKTHSNTILKNLFNIISLMNEVEPVNNIWGRLEFTE